jgi:hypothetical protein
MKNSTIVGISGLVLVGVGAFIYFVGKKSPLKNSLGVASKTEPIASAPLTPPKRKRGILGIRQKRN